MDYFAVDIFKDKNKAEATAEALRSVRENVVVQESKSVIINDCQSEQHKALADLECESGTLYIVTSEG